MVMPAVLPAQQPSTAHADMRVVDTENEKKVREEGRATRTITYVADQRIRTAHGEFDTKRIELHFRADLNLADVDELTVLFVVPGRGIVAEQSTETVKVLGFGRPKKRTLIRSLP
jgi:hypothetical protein